MSDQIIDLLISDKVRVSQHAFRRMLVHSITSNDLLGNLSSAVVLEDYPDYYAGAAVLMLHFATDGAPIHAVWGIEKGTAEPAVLITAYRPDPVRWSDDFRRRKP